MRKPWLVFALLAAAIFAVAAGVDFYRHRLVRSDRDLFRFLPQTDATILYVNADGLRRAGILGLLAGVATARDIDYSAFLRETHFDYTRDLSAIAGSVNTKQSLFVIRGRFDWTSMRNYAKNHGGACRNDTCELPSATPGRWASFFPIQSDVMALAAGTSRSAAEVLRSRHQLTQSLPAQPVWVKFSHALLQRPPELPLALRIFVISLQPADSVVLSLAQADSQTSARFQLELNAVCPSAPSANSIRNQLELETKFLRIALAREHVQPNAKDVTGLLTAGTFRASGDRVEGSWPISKELLNSLQ